MSDPRAVRYARRRKTDQCGQPILPTGAGDGTSIRATDDPTEAVERIVSRRKLLIDGGDIFISRAIAPIRGSDERDIYHLSRQDLGPLPGRYTSFEHAVVAGDQLATTHRVRLYFQESPDHLPQLLKDCRP